MNEILNVGLVETTRIKLRDYTEGDWEFVHEYAQCPDFCKFQSWGPNTVADTKSFIQLVIERTKEVPREHFDLAVIEKVSGKFIGGCDIRYSSKDKQVGSIGHAINPSYQNQGFATEAGKLLLKFGFMTMGLKKITASCDALNLPSKRVLEKLGMNEERIIKGHFKQKGKIRNSCIFSLACF